MTVQVEYILLGALLSVPYFIGVGALLVIAAKTLRGDASRDRVTGWLEPMMDEGVTDEPHYVYWPVSGNVGVLLTPEEAIRYAMYLSRQSDVM